MPKLPPEVMNDYEPFYLLMQMPMRIGMTPEEWRQLRKALPDSLNGVNFNFLDGRVFYDKDKEYEEALQIISRYGLGQRLTSSQIILISVALRQSKKRVSKSVREMFSDNLFYWPTKCFDRCLRNYLMLADKEECEWVLKDVQERVDSIRDDYKKRELL